MSGTFFTGVQGIGQEKVPDTFFGSLRNGNARSLHDLGDAPALAPPEVVQLLAPAVQKKVSGTFFTGVQGIGQEKVPDTFFGSNTIYSGGDKPSYILLPIIPPAK